VRTWSGPAAVTDPTVSIFAIAVVAHLRGQHEPRFVGSGEMQLRMSASHGDFHFGSQILFRQGLKREGETVSQFDWPFGSQNTCHSYFACRFCEGRTQGMRGKYVLIDSKRTAPFLRFGQGAKR
jgi:hypothetical protein